MSAKTAFHGKMTIFGLWKLPFPAFFFFQAGMKSVLPFYCANQQKYIPPCKSFSKSNIYIFYCKSPRDQSFGGKGLKKTQHLTHQRQIIELSPFWTVTGSSKYSVGLFLPSSRCCHCVQFDPSVSSGTSPPDSSIAHVFVSHCLLPTRNIEGLLLNAVK